MRPISMLRVGFRSSTPCRAQPSSFHAGGGTQPGRSSARTWKMRRNEAGLPCRSLLGTQIAPEDVSGIPRIVGERSVFCPPRILLPEDGKPFCLFLDELPASPPDIQKAFYALLLERRIGEFFMRPTLMFNGYGEQVASLYSGMDLKRNY